MTHPTVSVIVVSRGRPDALSRCLAGIAQQDYPTFEVVVVADAPGCDVVLDGMKSVLFETPNISAARNLGLSRAAGAIVAFIDDDAVPEPTWLTYLCQPFLDPNVAASGGFVIGRNGISFQWKARMAFADGSAVPMQVPEDKPTILKGESGRAIKTEGTNMAFRASILREIGGFDPVFAFYLDETDVNMRLGTIGTKTAIAPLAQVHHGFAASERRSPARVPLDLFAIGASLRAFVVKHQKSPDLAMIKRAERSAQRDRLLRHMRDGNLMPRDVGRILKTFDAGWDAAVLDKTTSDIGRSDEFLPFVSRYNDQPTLVLSGRFWQRAQLFAKAEAAVADGRRVSVILLSLTARFHRVWFDPRGFWVQRGGQFGKSNRDMKWFQFWRGKARIMNETARVALVRRFFTRG